MSLIVRMMLACGVWLQFRIANCRNVVSLVCAPMIFSPAGTYLVKFTLPSANEAPSVNVTVHVVNCEVGDVTSVTGDACQTCEKGYYSLDPRNSTCDICVPNAECSGGSSIIAAPQFWHSSPRSIQMHRWDKHSRLRLHSANTHLLIMRERRYLHL
jgi:hypothetical protein